MFRVVSTDFWTDPLVVDAFSPEDKYFMLYLLTNPHTKQCGIYQLNIKTAAFETGYSVDTIACLLERFENKYDRIVYNRETQEIGIYNYIKHSVIRGGAPVNDCIRSELLAVKDRGIIANVYDRLTSFYESTEKESFKDIGKIFFEFSNTTNSNDNENDNENEESYHDSYYDSSKKTKTAEKPSTKQLLFEAFWKEYPKKTNKTYSKKCFDRISDIKNTIDHIMYSLNRYKNTYDWKKENGQYIPMASTWLNRKQWLDFDMKPEQDDEYILPEPQKEVQPIPVFTEEQERMYREAMRGNINYDYTTEHT